MSAQVPKSSEASSEVVSIVSVRSENLWLRDVETGIVVLVSLSVAYDPAWL